VISVAMEEDLVARLIAAPPVAALCGERWSWFGRQRGDSVPAGSLTKISPGREWTHDGPDQLDRPRVQIDIWAASDLACAAAARAVRDEMEQARIAGSTKFHPAQLSGEGWDEEVDAAQAGGLGGERLFRIRMDFLFYHEEN
jgi:hypothetical protein